MSLPVRTASVRIGAREFAITSDDIYLDQVGADFEPAHVEMLGTLINEHDTVLDIGANIGCTALLFAQFGGRVIAFEPGHGTFDFLRTNVTAAGFDNVTIENIGLGREDASLQLVSSPTNRAGAFISNFDAPSGHPSEAVTIVRGDHYVTQHEIERIDYIKIDTEGYERDVIEGLRATLERDRPVVTMELNHWCLNAFQRTSVPDFLDFLRSVFPFLFAFDDGDLRDLHNPDDSYLVMHEHIVRMRYREIVAAFDITDLDRFTGRYRRQQAAVISSPAPDTPLVSSPVPTPSIDADTLALSQEAADLSARCAVLEQEVAKLTDRNDELGTRCRTVESELDRLISSKSWRYTAALRRLWGAR